MIRRRGLIGGALFAAVGVLGLARRSKAAGVYPPSASPDFPSRCIRCSRCADVCPVQAIHPGPVTALPFSQLPIIEARETACTLCMKCTEVCPTGALSPIERALPAIREHVHMGIASLDRKACLTHAKKATCRLCFEVCPFSGEAIVLSGLGQGPVIMAQACVGCGLCAEACPTRAKAIEIVPTRGGTA